MKLSHIPHYLSHIPHYTTLQKLTRRIDGTSLLWKIIIFSFILFLNTNRLLIGIDSSGFKTTNASQYYYIHTKLT